MKRFLSLPFSLAGRGCLKLSRLIYQSNNQVRTAPWFEVNGDHTLRLDYELNKKSLVFDMGGYEGQWASDIFSKYVCRVNVFEPVPLFAKQIEKRFSTNKKIKVFDFGLGAENKDVLIGLDANSSSVYKKSPHAVKVNLVCAKDFFEHNKITKIDLMKINIEGGEYELLEHLLETGLVQIINNIQVQFHDFLPDAQKRMQSIQTKLAKTHKITYQYPFVWENWKLTTPDEQYD